MKRFFSGRGTAPVQGNGGALVFGQCARVFRGQRARGGQHGVERGRSPMDIKVAVIAPFQSVQAHRWQLQRLEQGVQLHQPASADQRQRAVQPAMQDGQGIDQARLDVDVAGRIGEIQQRPVHIEKQRPIGRDGGRQRKRLGFRRPSTHCEHAHVSIRWTPPDGA